MSNVRDGLSDAELEALEDEDLDSTNDLKALVDEDEDDDEDLDPDSPASNNAGSPEREGSEDPTGGEGTGEGEGEGTAPPAAEGTAHDDSQTPSFSVSVPDIGKIEDSLKGLVSERDQLEKDYEAGDSDLTYAEHRAKMRDLDDKISDLREERAEAKALHRMNEAYEQEWWSREIRSFKRDAMKSDGVDYNTDQRLANEWDKCVRFLGNDPENANRSARWFLEEAHEMVKARFKLGKTEAPPASTAADRRAMVDEAVAARRNKAGTPPKTLANIPEAGAESEQESEFSHLDNLSGLALERALAKMTPDQQDRYLNT